MGPALFMLADDGADGEPGPPGAGTSNVPVVSTDQAFVFFMAG
jgi:hypothetical protein